MDSLQRGNLGTVPAHRHVLPFGVHQAERRAAIGRSTSTITQIIGSATSDVEILDVRTIQIAEKITLRSEMAPVDLTDLFGIQVKLAGMVHRLAISIAELAQREGITVAQVQQIAEHAQIEARILRETFPQAEIDGGMHSPCQHAHVDVFSGRGNAEHYTERGDCTDCGEPVILTYGRATTALSIRVMTDAEQIEYEALKATSAAESAMESTV